MMAATFFRVMKTRNPPLSRHDSLAGQPMPAIDWSRIKEALGQLRADWQDQPLPRRLRSCRNRRHSDLSRTFDRDAIKQRV